MRLGNFPGRIIPKKGTMAGLARALTIFVGSTVVDPTDLHVYYDLDIKWNSPEPPDARASFGADGVSLLMSVVRNEFGLQFVSTKGRFPIWLSTT
jgi:uncharacterized protein (TIGR03435 family)